MATDVNGKSLYSDQLIKQISSMGIVQKFMNGYDCTKHSCTLTEVAFDDVEYILKSVARFVHPTYEQYIEPKVEGALEICHTGLEKMRNAMHGAQSAAVTSASMGIGAALVAVQLSVTLCIAGVNLVLSSVIKSKEVGSSAWERAKATELSIEKFLLDLVRRVYGITEGPVNVVIDHVHSILDIANGLVNHAFGIESEPDPPECSIGRRAINLGSRVGETLSSRAHEEVIDPLCKHAKSITDQLSKSLDLADMIRERQAWALEKAEQINSSIADLKARLDEEAAKLNVNPEEILMNSVHQSSLQLANQLKQLKEKSHEILTEAASLKLDAALAYVDKLQETVRGTKDVYQLKDDVLLEARSKLNELATWLSTLLIRDSTESP